MEADRSNVKLHRADQGKHEVRHRNSTEHQFNFQNKTNLGSAAQQSHTHEKQRYHLTM